MGLFGTKSELPQGFAHVEHAGDPPQIWFCESCSKRFARFDHPGSSDPVATPAVVLEIQPWVAAGQSQEEFERGLNVARRADWMGGAGPVSCRLNFCSACRKQAEETRQRLDRAASPSQSFSFTPGLHVTAIKSYLAKESRMWGLPEDIAEYEWSCLLCHRRENYGSAKNVEMPALKWHLDAVRDPYGRVTADALVASLCEKCGRAIDPVARQAFQNQTQGVQTT
jgi:hypothetical protein